MMQRDCVCQYCRGKDTDRDVLGYPEYLDTIRRGLNYNKSGLKD